MKNSNYKSEANFMCSVLVREISLSSTWKDKQDICMAILDVRREQESMEKEWEHLNGNTNTTFTQSGG